jgi:hypothetical protein
MYLGRKTRAVTTCGVCSPTQEKEAMFDDEDEVDDSDELPETIDMPLLELRERQLAACTRVMRSVAGALRKLDADYGKYQEDSKQFIKQAERLEAVRAGYGDPEDKKENE